MHDKLAARPVENVPIPRYASGMLKAILDLPYFSHSATEVEHGRIRYKLCRILGFMRRNPCGIAGRTGANAGYPGIPNYADFNTLREVLYN
jgi:hypothetical protein